MSINDEEPDEFPAMSAESPFFVSPHIQGAGNSKYTQTVFAIDHKVSVPIPSCLDRFVVDGRGGSPKRRFSGQGRDDLQKLLKSESVLVEISVGSHPFWHIIGGDSADDNDGYLGKASADNV